MLLLTETSELSPLTPYMHFDHIYAFYFNKIDEGRRKDVLVQEWTYCVLLLQTGMGIRTEWS